MGRKTSKIAFSIWDFVILPQEDQATAIGNMHRKIGKDHACGSGDMLADRQTNRQTDTHTHTETCSSQYFVNALTGEVITYHCIVVIFTEIVKSGESRDARPEGPWR